jgi:hypothetical protein
MGQSLCDHAAKDNGQQKHQGFFDHGVFPELLGFVVHHLYRMHDKKRVAYVPLGSASAAHGFASLNH